MRTVELRVSCWVLYRENTKKMWEYKTFHVYGEVSALSDSIVRQFTLDYIQGVLVNDPVHVETLFIDEWFLI